jgi:hypothetical protein
MNRIIPVVLFLMSGLNCLTSQEVIRPDTIIDESGLNQVAFIYNDFEAKGKDFLTLIDTSFSDVHRYEPTFGRNRYFAYLGNQGLAHTNLVFTPVLNSGYKFGINAFDLNLFFNDSVRYYMVSKPFTQLDYVMGVKREQHLRVLHTQDVASWFNAGLQFNYISSPGLYRNQKGDDKNFVFTTRFKTRDSRYMVLANYLHNKLKIRENGGVSFDTVFEQNVVTSRDGILVNLNTARNYVKENSFYVKQLFNIPDQGKFLTHDAFGDNSSLKRNLPGVVTHSVQYTKTTFLYEQDLSDNNGFYQFTFDSASPTYDSTHIFKVENQLSWTNSDQVTDHRLTLNFKLRHLYVEQSIDTVNAIFNQLIPAGEIRLNFSDALRLNVFGDYIAGGNYSGDFTMSGRLLLNTPFGLLSYELKSSEQRAPELFNFYLSNHFIWNNHFKKQFFLINKIGYDYKTWRAGISLFSIDRYIYFDQQALPAQMAETVQVFQGRAAKTFKLGDCTLDALAIYQKASSTDAIRIPEWLIDVSLFYTKPLFKQATTIQTGFDIFYYSTYFAYGYMPATRSFYIQNEKKTGDYIYADFFFNVRIKRAYLFLKYNNLGFLLDDFRYYTVPSYPMKDGGIRFGVSWAFYD